MTREEVLALQFPVCARGFPFNAVRSQLALIADLQDKGFAPRSYGLLDSGYRRNRLGRGYDPEAVDQFFAELAREVPPGLRVLPEIPDGRGGEVAPGRSWRQHVSNCEAEWQRVSDLPGVRLLAAGGKLTGSAGEVLLTRDRSSAPSRRRFAVNGEQSVSSGALILATGQVLRVDASYVCGDSLEMLMGVQVTDLSTSEPVLWIRGVHFDRSAGAHVLLPGQRCLVFPVMGTRRGNAVLTGVTESGSKALWVRRLRIARYEIVVSPDRDLTPETLCVAALTPGLLATYFKHPEAGGGGG